MVNIVNMANMTDTANMANLADIAFVAKKTLQCALCMNTLVDFDCLDHKKLKKMGFGNFINGIRTLGWDGRTDYIP